MPIEIDTSEDAPWKQRFRAWAESVHPLLQEAGATPLLSVEAEVPVLSEEYWDHSNLRVNHFHFTQELLRDQNVTVGRIDSRFKGRSIDRVGATMQYDPFMAGVGPAFNAGFMHYYTNDLGQ